MVLGPAWRDRGEAGPAADEHALRTAARAAGEELMARLRLAEERTAGWTDTVLTEMLVDAALSRCMTRLAATGAWGEANRLPSGELWRVAGPLLDLGVLQHCARFKPHGYAGDYEMLSRICEDICCDHPLGRAFDRYFQNQAAPQAVRSRTEQTAAAIAAHCLSRGRRRCRIASVGAGPAIDVRRGLAAIPQDRRGQVEVVLLDLDPHALEFARQGLAPLVAAEALCCERVNLFRLPGWTGAAAVLGRPDVLVCSGLFDYLDDGTAAAMIALFWRQLAEGGLLLVGNFAPHNPTRAYMEWIGNWYLTYRTADELERLGIEGNIPPHSLSVTAERLGVDLFLVGRA